MALASNTRDAIKDALPLIPVYLDMLEAHGAAPSDTLLVGRLILDYPAEIFRDARRLPAIFDSKSMAVLRRAAARKLLVMPPKSHPAGASLASVWLFQPRLPFDDIYPEERRLLRQVSHDDRAVGLIQRLPELGARAAPLLVDALLGNAEAKIKTGKYEEEGISHDERDARKMRDSIIEMTIKSLCQLGADARREYPRLRDFHIRTKFDDRFVHTREWDLMIYRVSGTTDDLFVQTRLTKTTDEYRSELERYASC